MKYTCHHLDGYVEEIYFQYREINQLPSYRAIGKAFEILANLKGTNLYCSDDLEAEVDSLIQGQEVVEGEWVYNPDRTVNYEQLSKFPNSHLLDILDTAIDNALCQDEVIFDWTFGQISVIEIIEDVNTLDEIHKECVRQNRLEKEFNKK